MLEFGLDTATNFDDVLNMAQRILDVLASDGGANTELAQTDRARLTAMCALVDDLAHSTWTRRRDRAAEVHEILERCPLQLTYHRRTDGKRGVSLRSVGHRDGLAVAHEAYWLEHGGDLEIEHPDPAVLDADLFERLCDDGIVDFIARSAPTYELRRCANDGAWYTPQIARRSRFCGPRCRQEFNNARLSADEATRTFVCAKCHTPSAIDNFSGLVQIETPGDTSDDRVRIGSLRDPRGGLLCVDCIIEHFPDWLRYVAPIIASQRRGEHE